MLYSEPIEVDYIRLAPDDAIVFKIVLKFLEAGTDLPVDRSVTEAGFHINTEDGENLTIVFGETKGEGKGQQQRMLRRGDEISWE